MVAIDGFPGVVAEGLGDSMVGTVGKDSWTDSSPRSAAPPDGDPCSLTRGVSASASATSSPWFVLVSVKPSLETRWWLPSDTSPGVSCFELAISTKRAQQDGCGSHSAIDLKMSTSQGRAEFVNRRLESIGFRWPYVYPCYVTLGPISDDRNRWLCVY